MNDLATSAAICAKSVPRKRRLTLEPNDADTVYFMYSGGFMKIGYTTNLLSRQQHLTGGNPHPVEIILAAPGTKRGEKRLHKMFETDRHRFEWFRVSDNMRDFFRAVDARANPDLVRVLGTSIERLEAAERAFQGK